MLSSRLGWAGVWGHGAVVFPPPRNNIDHGEAPWNAEVPRPVPAVSDPKNGVWCPIPNPFFNNNLTGTQVFPPSKVQGRRQKNKPHQGMAPHVLMPSNKWLAGFLRKVTDAHMTC